MKNRPGPILTLAALLACAANARPNIAVDDKSPLREKAEYLERDLVEKHSLGGLYVSIVPSLPAGARLSHSVNEPGNVIHAGVWTGRYLAGVGYQYAVTKDPRVRAHGWQILIALRILQEVTGQPGLLARGYVKGHGPVAAYERDGADSKEWHQGQANYADYRFYSDVSVDNFNAVLYGYAVYFDLTDDDAQKQVIRQDVDRMMTRLLDNHCRIIDLNGKPTQFGHVGIDPDPARDAYYNELYARRRGARGNVPTVDKMPLRSSLMLLPDLLIAHHITGRARYLDFYRRVVARFKANPEPEFYRRPRSAERVARTNHSAEGQSFEALYSLIRYERDPELLDLYSRWLKELWEANWNEGNPLFTYMTLSLLAGDRANSSAPAGAKPSAAVPHASDGLSLANQTLKLYPIDRVLRPIMNSIRKDLELSPYKDRSGHRQAQKPIPINERPLDNEYAWKASPYELDGWLKPTVTAFPTSCDDPQVAWFCDSSGRAYRTLDHGKTWDDVTTGLMGAGVENLVSSGTRTFVLWAKAGAGVYISRDGGLSWRIVAAETAPSFPKANFSDWVPVAAPLSVRITPEGALVRSRDGGQTAEPAMQGWRIPLAKSVFRTTWGILASGPGGAYLSNDGQSWHELKLWPELETGGADYLHAYWMGRYCGFVAAD